MLRCSGAGEEVAERTAGGSDRAAGGGAEGLAVEERKGCNAKADVGDNTCRGWCRLRQLPPPLFLVVLLHWPLRPVGC